MTPLMEKLRKTTISNRRLRMWTRQTIIVKSETLRFSKYISLLSRKRISSFKALKAFTPLYTFVNEFYVPGSTIILTLLAKRLKIDDSILGMISALSVLCGTLLYAFATNSITFYLGK